MYVFWYIYTYLHTLIWYRCIVSFCMSCSWLVTPFLQLSSARFTQIQHVAPDLQVTFSTSVDPSCSSFRIFGLSLTNIFWQGGSWRYLKPPKVNSLEPWSRRRMLHGEPLPLPHRLSTGPRSGPAVLLRRETIAGQLLLRSSALDVGWSETVVNIWHVIWCVQFGCFKQLPNCICFERNQVDWINNPAPVFFVTLAVD